MGTVPDLAGPACCFRVCTLDAAMIMASAAGYARVSFMASVPMVAVICKLCFRKMVG